MSEPKYITINGVMKKKPNYVPPGGTEIPHATPVNASNAPLAVVSSMADIDHVQETLGPPLPLSASTANTIEMLQDDYMLQKYKSRTPLDGGELLDQVGERFAKYEVPLGMLNKLMMLSEYKLDFLIDDSGSMSAPTDVDALDATEPVKTLISNRLGRPPRPGEKMTRIQEAEDRLHVMMSFLAYMPIEHIQLRFLNKHVNGAKPFILIRDGKTPEEFEEYAHQEIRNQFASLRLAGTPVEKPLLDGFAQEGKWAHYLFNDGEPNEGGARIAKLIANRPHPENHPLTLISCTNEDNETKWMKEVDAQAKYVAEVDDFSDEKFEVERKQGSALPYTRGLWLLCQLVAAINPFDLDALDENLPLTKFTLDNILGRKLSPTEYQYYFEKNPNAALYVNEYSRFLNEELLAREIISSTVQDAREKNAGYISGERPEKPLANINSQLAPITAVAQRAFSAQYPTTTVDDVTKQLSAVSIAPNAAFMPPAPTSAAEPTQAKEHGFFNVV
ncbi:hypothetical protein [Legionella sp. km772]|uniref:hypothetical protein n=1 Tax=Legionella sp. km772 TaxID=2498111 RepID=UPI000F8DD85E|nr:hypothetical protein [Legionella sp. km772]RUR05285.1 hypothetical protein ELY15_14510 [Legionella sp. km772]